MNEDLNREAALAMGWKILRDEDELNPYYDLYEITKGALVTAIKAKNWNPTTDVKDWWHFITFMDEQGWTLKLHGNELEFIKWTEDYRAEVLESYASLSLLFPATIRAGLKALGVEE